ncbi:MAG: LysR family transcriptional regulator [Firmicutes bacterium]|nr:LysR family transcriptional regulator [Bacillota bacterium]
MTTNQLKYFVTAAETLSFTETGKIHFISQTAVTQHIQALEEQLQVQLFKREKRHIELTPAGKVFLAEARMMLERDAHAIEITRKAAKGQTGTINIGYVKGQENTPFDNALLSFHKNNPGVYFRLFRKAHLDLMMLLDRGDLDIAINICYENTKAEGFESHLLTKQKLFAVLPATHPYAGLSSISRVDLKNDGFIMTKFYDDPNAKKYDFIIPELYAYSGFVPEILGKSSDIETILILVSMGIGVSILPESAIKYARQSGKIAVIPLVGEYEHVDIMAFWKAGNKDPILRLMLQELKNDSMFHPAAMEAKNT